MRVLEDGTRCVLMCLDEKRRKFEEWVMHLTPPSIKAAKLKSIIDYQLSKVKSIIRFSISIYFQVLHYGGSRFIFTISFLPFFYNKEHHYVKQICNF